MLALVRRRVLLPALKASIWIGNPDGGVLSVGVSADPLTDLDWSSETHVRQFARQLAEAAGGGLIEAAALAPPPRAIVRLIYKRLIGAGYIYTGMLVMTGGSVPMVWTVVAGERVAAAYRACRFARDGSRRRRASRLPTTRSAARAFTRAGRGVAWPSSQL